MRDHLGQSRPAAGASELALRARHGPSLVEARKPVGSSAPRTQTGRGVNGRDLFERIDAATADQVPLCWHCREPLGGSVSNDFCGPDCQEAWHAVRAEPLTGYVEAGHDFYEDEVRFNAVEGSPLTSVAAPMMFDADQWSAYLLGWLGTAHGYPLVGPGLLAWAPSFTITWEPPVVPEPVNEAEVYTTPVYDEGDRLDQAPRTTLSTAIGFARGERVEVNGKPYRVVEVLGDNWERRLALVADEDHPSDGPFAAGVRVGARRAGRASVVQQLCEVFDVPPAAIGCPDVPDTTRSGRMTRALAARRNRNTGPEQRRRAPRRIDPPRGWL